MKKYLFISFILLVAFKSLVAQDDKKARAILDQTAETYKKSTYKIEFSLKLLDTKTENQKIITGTVSTKGEKFKLEVPDIQTYYDGKTQYVYMKKNKEVSLTTPTKEDLQSVNPTYIISSYTKGTTVQFSMDNKPDLPYHIIDVFPEYRTNKDFYKAIVKINKKTKAIISIKVLNRNGVHTLFKIKKYQKDLNFNDWFFVFNFDEHPNVIRNDLR